MYTFICVPSGIQQMYVLHLPCMCTITIQQYLLLYSLISKCLQRVFFSMDDRYMNSVERVVGGGKGVAKYHHLSLVRKHER